MTFSDDDLKRLKRHISYYTDKKDQAYLPWPPNLDIEALLARLEAAESVLEAYIEGEGSDSTYLDYEVGLWRKSAGK